MKCDAHLYIADKYSDNEADMRCQLEVGHDGEHKEVFMRYDHPVTVTWTVDEKLIRDAEEKERDAYYQRIFDFAKGLLGDKEEVDISEADYVKYGNLRGGISFLPPYDSSMVLHKNTYEDSYYFVIKNNNGDVDFIVTP